MFTMLYHIFRHMTFYMSFINLPEFSDFSVGQILIYFACNGCNAPYIRSTVQNCLTIKQQSVKEGVACRGGVQAPSKCFYGTDSRPLQNVFTFYGSEVRFRNWAPPVEHSGDAIADRRP